jgi:hypothetical protein
MAVASDTKRMASKARFLIASLLVASLTVAGCGDSGDDAGSSVGSQTERELLSRVSAGIAAQVPTRTDEIIYADFVAAREGLGLAGDADIYDPPNQGSRRAAVLGSLASRALRYAGLPFATPLAQAIDGRAIKAAAGLTVIGSPGILVIRTTQPFDKISSALRRRGYARSGDLLTTRRPLARTIYRVVADAGRGVVVLAGSAQVARAALEGRDAKLSRAAALIGDVPGAARAANATRRQCVLARAAGQHGLAPQKGGYLVVVDGKADAQRLKVAGRTLVGPAGELKIGDAEANGDRVRAKFTSEDPANAVFTEFIDDDLLGQQVNAASPYDCR